jgi:hypothetical protein
VQLNTEMSTALRIRKALDAFDHKLAFGDEPMGAIRYDKGSRSGEVHWLPHASKLGSCPARSAFERVGIEPTHPQHLVQNVAGLAHKFALGAVMAGWASEALEDSGEWADVLTEVALNTDHYRARADVMLVGDDDLIDVVEIKASVLRLPTRNRMLQVISYIESIMDSDMPDLRAREGYIISWDMTAQVFFWNIFRVYWDEANQAYRASKLYGDVVETLDDPIYSISLDEFWGEVELQQKYLDAARNGEFLSFVEYPIDDQGKAHPAGCCWTEQPKRYQKKYGDYKAGDVRLGVGRVRCPFAGHCFPELVGVQEFQIGLDENERAYISIPEPQ